ncbi:MAG: sulfite exporter TauE/SafE family protein [Crenarchaeota archaeon]|nr:sulfite exporter TauE/SafE family protein [Thermoproteota archaeon]
MDIKSLYNENKFTIFLLLVMIAITTFVFSAEKQTIKDVPQINATMGVILILVGLAAGLLGGWIGTGGCSIMLPVLHFWLGFPAPIAIGTTLFAVIFTTISGGYGHFKRKNVDKRVALWVGGAGILGVILGSWLFLLLSKQSILLGLILGIVFLWPALRMIWEGIKGYKEIKQEHIEPSKMQGSMSESIEGHPAKLSLFGFIVGILTGLVGLGGGYALVPGLIYLFGAPVYITMGTSLAIMAPMATLGGLIKLAQGFVFLGAALMLGIGAVVGAQIGSATIKKFKPFHLKLIFGIYFLYVAAKFIGNYFGIYIW